MANQENRAKTEGPGAIDTEALETLNAYADQRRRAVDHAELIGGVPAVLERGVIYLVAAALIVTLGFLYFSSVHVVVETKGKLLPEGNVVSLQAGHGGVVTEVFAHAGDHLPAGAVVAEIDASELGLNLAQVRRKLVLDQGQLELLHSTARHLDGVLANPRQPPEHQAGNPIATAAYQSLSALGAAAIQLEAALRDERLLPDRRTQLEQEYQVTEQRIAMLRRSRADSQEAFAAEQLALTRKKDQLENTRRLADNKLLSVVELNTEEERYRGAQASLIASQQQVDQLDVDISSAQLRLSELKTKQQTVTNDGYSSVRAAQAGYDQALANVRQERDNVQVQTRGVEADIENGQQQIGVSEGRQALATITMPVAGTIAEIRVRNAGEIVAAGAAIATVVPNGVPLMVEANASDKDVGFMRPGVDARIKVDAYPFQQFGTVGARVVKVLPAVGGNASFVVYLELTDNKLTANGADFYLFPGLSVQADVITQERRLLNVLLQGRNDTGTAAPR